jgi:hypothetical protein
MPGMQVGVRPLPSRRTQLGWIGRVTEELHRSRCLDLRFPTRHGWLLNRVRRGFKRIHAQPDGLSTHSSMGLTTIQHELMMMKTSWSKPSMIFQIQVTWHFRPAFPVPLEILCDSQLVGYSILAQVRRHLHANDIAVKSSA